MTDQIFRTANIVIKNDAGSIEIDNLRVEFDIQRGDTSDSDTSKIAIYNLNKTKRTFCLKQNSIIQLSVGYQGFSDKPLQKLILLGDIIEVKTKRSNADIITILECGDTEKTISDSIFNKTFKKGFPIKTIVKELISGFGVIFSGKEIDEKISNKKIFSGLTIEGKIKKSLDVILENEGYRFTIQNNQLRLIKITGEKNINQALLLKKETGLLDVPFAKKDGEGMEIMAFINPSLSPGDTIKVESLNINAFYAVQTLKLKGDTHGRDWFMKIGAI